ncbi:hypothetical protein BJ166DRAFT_294637 [Pestalotiopsis sp. NC0098]|nr:hypothetical protein BJ166DRAFT_294637 [Pestalotiopsis sp. NC0098]
MDILLSPKVASHLLLVQLVRGRTLEIMSYQFGTDLPNLDNLSVQDPTAREGLSSRSKSRPQNLHILPHPIQYVTCHKRCP